METIIKKNGKNYFVEIKQGVQYFSLEYRGTKAEAKFMKKMFDHALEAFRKECVGQPVNDASALPIHSVSKSVCTCICPNFNPITDRCLICDKPYKL